MVETLTLRKIRIDLTYDGSGYQGWQIQPNALTIQEVLEDRIYRITRFKSRVIASGRTDAGVHALNQVAHFKTPSSIPARSLKDGLNALLPSDIRITALKEVEEGFHARFSATGKRYLYQVMNAEVASPFLHRYSWWIPIPLDVEAMNRGAKFLLGVHDFTSFRASGCGSRHPIREVWTARWETGEEGLLRFVIEANAFLKQMVRIIIGTLVDVGLGKLAPEEVRDILEARDRGRAGITAPAKGLFLAKVFYSEGP